MKAVLISIQPKWVAKIASGEKTIEVRKTAPKCEVPFKCYIYCTKAKPYLYREANPPFELFLDSELYEGKGYDDRLFSGKVIGEFICDKVYEIVNGKSSFFCNGATRSETNLVATQSCLDFCDMAAYLGDKNGYGWHISDLKIYDKPKELSEFYTIDESGNDCCIACVHHETPIEEMPCRTCTGERRYLYRAPQSWQYVEE